ncbi:jacalin-related lectin 19-like isoform X2 [Hordeum vulgare subsp. vulgare]|uniref:jacalin-related lectin 19-like isoform X2 n=1 Tax=Hordeum vulgare subsp. vulgare TaxID=112509 RepID=UPI0002954849|nr:jacalin-related lectin 19-like isoform X2 [Hordeum vulgare subsp. vulgare]
MQQQQPPPPQRKMVASKKLMKVGPWGGTGGNPWDDGGHTGIRGITLSYDHRCVVSIAVEYDRSGLTVPGERHGGAGGNHTTQFKLCFPDEHLTAVSGRYGAVAPGGSPVIRSLAFRTERAAYGPFGAVEGTPFQFAVEGGVIVGFCGRSGWQLDAVGMYVAPLRPEKLYDKVHHLGLMAYRSVMHRLGPAPAPPQDELQEARVQHQRQNGSVVQTGRKNY